MKTTSAFLCVICASAISAALVSDLHAQHGLSVRNPNRSPQINAAAVPGPLRQNLLVLGERLASSGQERLLLQGEITAPRDGVTTAHVVYELPDKVRFESTGGDPKILIFDGVQAQRSGETISDSDRALLESIVYDSPEGFFDALRADASIRLLGSRFRADDGTTPRYQGPWFDIYELILPIRTAATPTLRQKQFFFDSVTALLRRVRYRTSQLEGDKLVETHISWNEAGGQLVPAEIVRTENGVQVFAFTTASASVGPKVEDGVFRSAQ